MKKGYYTSIVAFTTPSGRMHLGHGLGHTLGDVVSRYQCLKEGKDPFFPIGIHATGKDLIKILDKLSALGDKTETYKRYNISEAEAKEILSSKNLDESVDKLVSIYKGQYEAVLRKLGTRINMDSFFSTHQNANHKFTQWTLRKLKEKNLIVNIQNPRYYCPKCEDIKAIESDFSEVSPIGNVNLEELSIQEGTVIFFEGKDLIIPVYTTRTETVFGVTNLYYNKDLKYNLIVLNKKKKPFVIEESSLEQLIEQLGGKAKIKNIKILKNNSELSNKEYINPLTSDKVPMLDASFVKKNNGTGFIMSVPSHDPFDSFYLQEVLPELLKKSKIIIVDSEGKPITFDVHNLTKDKLKEIRKQTYKEQEEGFINPLIQIYGGMSISEAQKKLLKDLIESGKGNIFFRIIGGEFGCRTDNTRIIAKRTSERAINYADIKIQNKTIKLIDEMKLNPKFYRKELKEYIRTRKAKPCERKTERNIGSISPFDKTRKIEALADSNIYMEFYGISQLINQNVITENQLSDDFFDYIFLDKGDEREVSRKTEININTLRQAKNTIKEKYPIDLNIAATEHKDVHFPFSLFNHAAILPENFFPKEYLLTSLITLKGEKMSKSKGNVVYLDDLLNEIDKEHQIPGLSKEAAYDSIRFFFINYQSLDRNFDWDPETYLNSGIKVLKRFVINKQKQIEELTTFDNSICLDNLNDFDKWLLTFQQRSIEDVTTLMNKRDFRKASITVYNLMENALKNYQQNGERNLGIEKAFIKTQLELIYPFTPRISEEIYEKVFGKKIYDWPTFNSNLVFPEESEMIECKINKNYKNNIIGKIQAELGQMFGRKEIKPEEEVIIKVPAQYTAKFISEIKMPILNNIKPKFIVDSTIRDVQIIKKGGSPDET